MKRNEWMALIATSIMMFAVCLSASAKIKNTVEHGIIMQEVCQRPAHPHCGGCPKAPICYNCLDDASFSILYNKVKNATFDDNKFDLLQVASLGCYYSCAQTARIMRIFTFGDKQLRVLRMMAPHIVDPQNATDIYNVLTFDSEKSEAGEIIRNSRLNK